MWYPKSKEQLYKPKKLLLFAAFLLPALSTVLFGGGMILTEYYGSYFSYIPALGTTLSLLSEGASVLFEIIELAVLLLSVMILGYFSYKKGFLVSLPIFLRIAVYNLAVRAISAAVFVVLWLCGVHESSYGLWSQLLPLLFSSLVDWAIYLVILLAAALGYSIIGGKLGREEALIGRALYPKTTAVFVLIFTLLNMIGKIDLVLDAFATGENFFLGCILPFVYPLIYGALMFYFTFLIAEPIVTACRGQNHGKDS